MTVRWGFRFGRNWCRKSMPVAFSFRSAPRSWPAGQHHQRVGCIQFQPKVVKTAGRSRLFECWRVEFDCSRPEFQTSSAPGADQQSPGLLGLRPVKAVKRERWNSLRSPHGPRVWLSQPVRRGVLMSGWLIGRPATHQSAGRVRPR